MVKLQFTLYISAASDLMAERDALARMIAELPVTLAWRIIQTPLGAEPLDLAALQTSDLYFLIMGSDIRAPVGLEWHTAYHTQRSIHAFLKSGVGRTPAGQVFINQTKVVWQPFTNAADLSRQAQQIVARQLVQHAVRYALIPPELEQLTTLQAPDTPSEASATGGEIGRSAVILSRERYTPGEGVIVDDS